MNADQGFMIRALQLARRGWYTTRPNPRVGCVLVRDGRIIGEGWHRRAGEPHAERLALAAVDGDPRGATAYVTLEPCCHFGRTPPCADALVEAGIGRVVVAMEDPNPLVAGRGLQRLREAGIRVEVGIQEQAARALNPGFIRRCTLGQPLVRVKLAASLDGRTAMANGESQWITSDSARRDVHRLRAAADALVTGIGTVIADDPSLNVRLTAADLGLDAEEKVPTPLRVILDSRLRTPETARLLRLPGRTLIVGTADPYGNRRRLEAAGAEVLIQNTATADSRRALDLPAVMRDLAARGVNELLVEAGPTLAGAFVQAGLVDELLVYLAPHVMGHRGRPLFHLPGVESMNERIGLRIVEIRAVGQDWRVRAIPEVGQTGVG